MRGNINEFKEFTSFTMMYVMVKNWIDWWHLYSIIWHRPTLFHCCYVFL